MAILPKNARPFVAEVIVWAETARQASQVLAERLACDEDCGFDYRVSWSSARDTDWDWDEWEED